MNRLFIFYYLWTAEFDRIFHYYFRYPPLLPQNTTDSSTLSKKYLTHKIIQNYRWHNDSEYTWHIHTHSKQQILLLTWILKNSEMRAGVWTHDPLFERLQVKPQDRHGMKHKSTSENKTRIQRQNTALHTKATKL